MTTEQMDTILNQHITGYLQSAQRQLAYTIMQEVAKVAVDEYKEAAFLAEQQLLAEQGMAALMARVELAEELNKIVGEGDEV